LTPDEYVGHDDNGPVDQAPLHLRRCRPEGHHVGQRALGQRRPLNPGTVTHTFARVIAKVGLPHIRFRDLRHTHATLMLKAGVHPKIVQERLGHGSIAVILDTYSHVVSGLEETAAQRFEGTLDRGTLKLLVNPDLLTKDVGKMWAKDGEFECEPRRTRTSNRLIKSQLRDKLLIAC